MTGRILPNIPGSHVHFPRGEARCRHAYHYHHPLWIRSSQSPTSWLQRQCVLIQGPGVRFLLFFGPLAASSHATTQQCRVPIITNTFLLCHKLQPVINDSAARLLLLSSLSCKVAARQICKSPYHLILIRFHRIRSAFSPPFLPSEVGRTVPAARACIHAYYYGTVCIMYHTQLAV